MHVKGYGKRSTIMLMHMYIANRSTPRIKYRNCNALTIPHAGKAGGSVQKSPSLLVEVEHCEATLAASHNDVVIL